MINSYMMFKEDYFEEEISLLLRRFKNTHLLTLKLHLGGGVVILWSQFWVKASQSSLYISTRKIEPRYIKVINMGLLLLKLKLNQTY